MTLREAELGLRRLADSFLGAALGAAFYAAWAIAVNWPAGPRIAFAAGGAHWLMSAFLTYTGTGLMRQCFAAARSERDGALFAFVGGLGFTYALLISVHHTIGTPNLVLTLVAGIVPNILFCGSYALLLSRTTPAREALPPATDAVGAASERPCA